MKEFPRHTFIRLLSFAALCGFVCVALGSFWIQRAVVASPTPAAPLGIRQISLAAKDLVYDPVGQRIYASLPGSAPNGNSLVQIEPVAGTVGAPVFVGSEPGKLAISDNSQYIYVSLDGSAAVRRIGPGRRSRRQGHCLPAAGRRQHSKVYPSADG